MLEHLGAEILGGHVGRRPGHYGDPARERTHAPFDLVRLAVNDGYCVGRDTEGVRANLRNNRFDSLSHRRDAGDDAHLSRVVDVDDDSVERAEPALFDKEAQSNANHLAAGTTQCYILPALLVTKLIESALKKARIVAGVVYD